MSIELVLRALTKARQNFQDAGYLETERCRDALLIEIAIGLEAVLQSIANRETE